MMVNKVEELCYGVYTELMCIVALGVLDTAEGSGRDILRIKTEKELAETVY